MKILIISPRLPHAHGKADSITVYHIAKYLSQSHDVCIACFYENEKELFHLADLKEFCTDVRPVPLKKWKTKLNMALSLFNSDMPLQTAYYADREMQRTVEDMLKEHQPDIAYAHLIRMAEYLKNKESVKRVLAMQISQTLNYRRMISYIKLTFYKILYNLEYKKVRHYEPQITRHFDSCLLISKYDKESFDDHETIDNIFYSPHGLDVEYYTKMENTEKEDAILFCGVLETPTNIDAIMYFYDHIYQLVKKRIPDVKLYLVGKKPPKVISKIAEKDHSVIVTGFVEDIRPYYSRIKVGIDPLRIGAGLQNKLLIGMSMEQPMVCTSIANEGIAAENGRHLLIADDPKSFSDAVVELMLDEKKAKTISQQARNFIQQRWTWEYYLQQLEEHLIKLAEKDKILVNMTLAPNNGF